MAYCGITVSQPIVDNWFHRMPASHHGRAGVGDAAVVDWTFRRSFDVRQMVTLRSGDKRGLSPAPRRSNVLY
jgi:hypothetical protein